jgi:hypothetical protein
MKTEKPIRCGYSMAMYNTNIENAIFQRGSYFVKDMTHAKDKFRYGCYFMDWMKIPHLLGSVSNIDSAKRFCNSIYHAYPFNDTLKNLEFEKLAKKYKLKTRPDNKPKQQAPAKQVPAKQPAPAKQQAPAKSKTKKITPQQLLFGTQSKLF